MLTAIETGGRGWEIRLELALVLKTAGVTESHVETRPTGFQHVQTRQSTPKHVHPNTSNHV